MSKLLRPLFQAMQWLRFAVNFTLSKLRPPCVPKNDAHIVRKIPAKKNEGRQSAFTFCGLVSATEIGPETCDVFCGGALKQNNVLAWK